jgi:multiple antibiotic resistance protein
VDGFIAELVNWPEYTKVFLAIYALVSPPMILPAFLGLLADRTHEEKIRAATIASITFLIIMIAFTLLGMRLLNSFGITLYGFQVAGGILLMRTGYDMIYRDPGGRDVQGEEKGSLIGITIMPVTIPALAGPGAISAVTVFSGQYESDPLGHQRVIIAVVLLLTVIVFFTYRFAAALDRILNATVMTVMSKIMGIIICAIAAEFILYGIAGHFPQVEII